MPKYAARTDENQKEIVDALRRVGATVHPLHAAGADFPDLAVGFRGVNYLIEVIGESKAKRFRANGGLSDGQVKWHSTWGGQCCTARSVSDALNAIGVGVEPIPIKGTIS